MSKHVTAVIAASAAGTLTSSFAIVAGKRISSNWRGPVEGAFQRHHCKVLMRDGWFPSDGVITVTENGSMERDVLAAFIEHLDHTAQKAVGVGTSILLYLDGNASRK